MLTRRSAIFRYMILIFFFNVILYLNGTKVEVPLVFLSYFKVPDIRRIMRADSSFQTKKSRRKSYLK